MFGGKWQWTAGRTKQQDLEKLVVPFLDQSPDPHWRSYGPLRALRSRHTKDLAIIVGLLFLVFSFLIAYIFLRNEDRAIFVGIGLVGALVTAFLILYQLGKRRFATVDLFGLEMLSIVRLFVITRFVHAISNMYGLKDGDLVSAKKFRSEASAAFLDARFATSFVSNSESLGTLSAHIVDHTTSFYTFLSAIREHTASLTEYIEKVDDQGKEIDPEIVDKYVGLVIYLVDILAVVGFRAINELIEAKLQNQTARHLCLLVGVAANNFLIRSPHYRTDEKWPLIIDRRSFYEQQIKLMKSSTFGARSSS